MRYPNHTCFTVSAMFVLCTLVPSLRAAEPRQDPLRYEMAEMAKTVKGILDEEKQSAIAVGDFNGPPRLDSQFGPGIQTMLADELTRLGVSVNKRADLTIAGNYSDATEDLNGGEQMVLKIHSRILSRNGEEIVKLTQRLRPRRITDNTTIAKVTGATVSLPPAGDKPTRNNEIKKALDKPTVCLDGTKISAKPGAHLAVEILVRPRPDAQAVARKPEIVDGQAFVGIEKDEIYELRLHNANGCEGAATITIDGVDVFHFSKDRDEKTDRPRYSHYIIPAKASNDVAGWHVTNDPQAVENLLSFKVTEYGKGAASMINGPRGKVGVITITYALAAESTAQLPKDDGARNSHSAETGFGPGQKQEIKELKRTIGVVREVVSIRYTR